MLQMALVWLRLAEYAAKTASELSTLVESQKSESASGKARGGGRLGALSR